MATKAGKKPQRKVDLPKGWWSRLQVHCQIHFGTETDDDIYRLTQTDRTTFLSAKETNQFTEARFGRLVKALGCGEPEELLAILHPKEPVAAQDVQRDALLLSLGHEVFTDYLTGLGYADTVADDDNLNLAIEYGRKWLLANPEDLYCRAMLLWTCVNRGKLPQILDVLGETLRWLDSPVPETTDSKWSEVRYQKLHEKLEDCDRKTAILPDFVRWHMEDTLVKAALFRCLRYQAQGSQLQATFKSLGAELQKQKVMKVLIETVQSQGEDWLASAIASVMRWSEIERDNGLPRLCLLWFSGQQRRVERMHFAIEQCCGWLKRYPSETFVRWATLWLAGLCPLGGHINKVIEETAQWLDSNPTDDERLVRMGYLWLVGAMGEPKQVQNSIQQTENWLEEHPHDDYIRIAFMLSLVRRRGTLEHRTALAEGTRKWLQDHKDIDGLTALAAMMCDASSA